MIKDFDLKTTTYFLSSSILIIFQLWNFETSILSESLRLQRPESLKALSEKSGEA